ncbi:DUF2637 domain-containing protein [Streptomyces subrutilus]|uniref:DUF2637 domain-containing protein n=1 Tax=Streptomyces subrutilus TaxID=36818 RepID=UPI0033CCEE22
MTTTVEPTATVPAPASPRDVPAAPDPVPAGARTAPDTPTAASTPPRDPAARAMRALVILAILGGLVVAGIGFAGSYNALRDLATEKGFGRFAYVFPIGVDAGIVVMYALDLVLAWRRSPKPLLRLIAHVLTLATVVFNANAGERTIAEDPLGAAMHAVMPVLFVATVEAARHMVIKTARLRLGVESDRVPLHRWLLAPWPTWRLYRRMRLWEIPSYAQMVALERERTVYRAWLQHTHGRNWKKKAGAAALLPFTLAPYGLSVDDALAQPHEQQMKADARAAAAKAREDAAAAREEARQVEAEQRATELKIKKMETAASLTKAEHRITAETGAAAAEARAAGVAATADAEAAAHAAKLAAEAVRREAERAATVAERLAAQEEAAEQSAVEAEAKAREAAALRAAAEDRKRAADAAAAAIAAERNAAEERRAAAEAERAEAVALEEAAGAAERQAAADRNAAEHRAAASVAELRAQEAEDLARLSPRERAVRRVARMILAAGGDMYAVPIEDVSIELGVGKTVAGERRQEAADLIASGYNGERV